MKLELKHLAPYLPYGLKAEMLDYKIDYVNKQYDEIVGIHQWDKNCLYWSALTVGGSKPNIERIKPILRPLSDLTKEIEHNGEKFMSIEYFSENYTDHSVRFEKPDCIILEDGYTLSQNVLGAPLAIIEKLFEWHFDIYGLIEEGLAVDINTL